MLCYITAYLKVTFSGFYECIYSNKTEIINCKNKCNDKPAAQKAIIYTPESVNTPFPDHTQPFGVELHLNHTTVSKKTKNEINRDQTIPGRQPGCPARSTRQTAPTALTLGNLGYLGYKKT